MLSLPSQKPVGAVSATSTNNAAGAQPEARTWAVVAAQLNHGPAIRPLPRPRPEAASQVGIAGGQAGAPGVCTTKHVSRLEQSPLWWAQTDSACIAV